MVPFRPLHFRFIQRTLLGIAAISALCLLPLRAQPVLNVQANGPDGIAVSLGNLPPGTQSGIGVLSFNTSLPVGAGPVLGLNTSFLSLLQAMGMSPPPSPGNPLSWTYPSPGNFPSTDFVLPAGSLPNLPSFDFLALVRVPSQLIPSNVSRYTPDPMSIGLSSTTLAEGTPFSVVVPGATSSNGSDFCAMLQESSGGFTRLFLNNTGPGLFQATIDPGALATSGQIVIAEGIGGSSSTTSPLTSMTVMTQSWTGTDPTLQFGPVATVASATGTTNGGACPPSGTGCWAIKAEAIIDNNALPFPTATWEVIIPANIAACICNNSTQIVLDIHGNVEQSGGGNVTHVHFDTWTHGTNASSGSICDCLDSVINTYKSVVQNQATGKLFLSNSCSVLPNGDYKVRLIFNALTGWQFETQYAGRPARIAGTLKICP